MGTGGPLKPSFGLSGAVPRLDRVSLPFARAFLCRRARCPRSGWATACRLASWHTVTAGPFFPPCDRLCRLPVVGGVSFGESHFAPAFLRVASLPFVGWGVFFARRGSAFGLHERRPAHSEVEEPEADGPDDRCGDEEGPCDLDNWQRGACVPMVVRGSGDQRGELHGWPSMHSGGRWVLSASIGGRPVLSRSEGRAFDFFHHKRAVSTITDIESPVGDNGDRPVAGPRCARPPGRPSKLLQPHVSRSLKTPI
jgi:hypothetical protein